MNPTAFLYHIFFESKESTEDAIRQEFLLNVLLFSISVIISVFALLTVQAWIRFGSEFRGANPVLALCSCVAFWLLFLLSRRGRWRLTSYLFIALLLSLVFLANLFWGTDLPQTWILYAFIIVIAGILNRSFHSFLIASAIGVFLISATYLQSNDILLVSESWKEVPFRVGDSVGAFFSFLLLSVVSWLFNSDLEKSLHRARKSEAALQVERDSLEIKVEERTRQLKETQKVQLEQMTRFAEFGQLASGIMHDLANPLTSMSLNLELAKKKNADRLAGADRFVDQALQASRRMEDLVLVARKQFGKKSDVQEFVLGDEIEQAVQILQSKARQAHVRFNTDEVERISIVGSPLKFHRVMLNLLGNAVEAYAESEESATRWIRVECHAEDGDAVIQVSDQAGGIPEETLEKIFEPFFTTKETGSGIGLPTVKDILKKDFSATIEVQSSKQGTAFEIRLPIQKSGS